LKYLARDAGERQWTLRYCGLGAWGDAALSRAQALAGAGAGPTPVARGGGFVVQEWLAGRPARAADARSPLFVDAVAAYLANRAALFGTGATVDVGPVVRLLEENAMAALGNPPGLAAALWTLGRLPPRAAFVPDAHMQLREWVCGPSGYTKVDTVDHGDGLRLPGPVDLAWDLAGAAVEYNLASSALTEIVRRAALAAHDSPDELSAAARAYRAPYAACALGEATLAMWEAPSDEEHRRWQGEVARYRGALARVLRDAVT
jgi:hypothetical protein